jgi:ATP-dependent RNA helicase DDX5/DBP2
MLRAARLVRGAFRVRFLSNGSVARSSPLRGPFESFERSDYARRDSGRRDSGRRDSGPNRREAQHLEPIEFDTTKLEPIAKDVYNEHPATASADQKTVSVYRAQHGLIVEGVAAPNPVVSFQNLLLPDVVAQDLAQLGFPAPSHIQAQAWPVAMRGRDLVGVAETGSGKTLAFAVPALMHVSNQVRTVKYLAYLFI